MTFGCLPLGTSENPIVPGLWVPRNTLLPQSLNCALVHADRSLLSLRERVVRTCLTSNMPGYPFCVGTSAPCTYIFKPSAWLHEWCRECQ